jgi:tetratricopeptide (TPR) repeat protein
MNRSGDVQGDSSGPNLGQFREALTSYTKALSLIKPVAAERLDYEALSCVAWLHFKCGDLQLRTMGAETAIASYSQGLKVVDAIATTLKDSRVDDLKMNGYMRLARAKMRSAAATEALANAQLADAAADRIAKHLRKDGPLNVAQAKLLVGNMLWLQGDLQNAWGHYQVAVRVLEELVDRDPENTTYRETLAEAYRRSGDLQGNTAYFHFGDPEKARFYQDKALRIARELAARDPNDASARSHLSVALRRMAAVQREQQPAQAIQLYHEALDVLRALMKEASEDLNYQRDLGNTHLGLSIALHNSGRLKQAFEEVTAALSVQKQMLNRSPERLAVREDMFDSLLAVGGIRLDMHDPPAAIQSFDEALLTAQYLFNHNKRSLYAERCLAMSYAAVADYHAYLAVRGPKADRLTHRAESLAWYDKSLAIWSNWRSRGIAIPFSSNSERQILRKRASIAPRIEAPS